jgi:cell wall-associated NlpC family hydrolase
VRQRDVRHWSNTSVIVGSVVGAIVVAAAGLAIWRAEQPGPAQAAAGAVNSAVAEAPSGSASPGWSVSASAVPFSSDSLAGPYTYKRATEPNRTEVFSASNKLVAVFTDGARTVQVTGPKRTFSEPATTAATVTTSVWVRLAPHAWTAGAQTQAWFQNWFPKQVGSTEPDLFGLAMQYMAGAANQQNSSGVRFAGEAKFGPITSSTAAYQNPLGERDDRADFYDYLGTSYTFQDGTAKPNPAWYGDLDCTGFIRILFGYRMGFPLLKGDERSGSALPRHSWAMAALGPGVQLFNAGAQQPPAADLNRLQPGDLLFFAEGKSSPGTIDHAGIYLGLDQSGNPRFLSSRMGANGPTFGDAWGRSVLSGSGLYARDFRSAKRI